MEKPLFVRSETAYTLTSDTAAVFSPLHPMKTSGGSCRNDRADIYDSRVNTGGWVRVCVRDLLLDSNRTD